MKRTNERERQRVPKTQVMSMNFGHVRSRSGVTRYRGLVFPMVSGLISYLYKSAKRQIDTGQPSALIRSTFKCRSLRSPIGINI